MTVLLCPLCSQPRFDDLESLRLSLVNAATQNISCPICNEVLVGLDKLTIHLFGHSLQSVGSTCMTLQAAPQEPGFVPHEDLPKPEFNPYIPDVEEKAESKALCTVNMEDLSFLTSWESPKFKPELKEPEPDPDRDDHKTDSSELSEYMSDLLNKKLPILNFVFTMDGVESVDKPEELVPESARCDACDLNFEDEATHSLHEELVHGVHGVQGGRGGEGGQKDDTPRHDCHLCPKSFKMKGSLMVHFRVAHAGVNSPESPVIGNPGSPEERNFHCPQCGKSFKKEQHLAQHSKTHDGKQWQCETCNKHFTTKYFLKKHQRLHTGEMPYCCPTCSKTFTFQQSYHKHLLYHSDDKPHECAECGRAFKELSTLHNHQRIHSGEKPFTCETCGKCFRQRVSYIVHQRIHTGVLPYQCTACKKKFRYKVSQRSHKCAAQPPGVVVRQPGDLIQRILEHRNTVLQCTE